MVHVRGSVDTAFKAEPGSDVYIHGSVRAGGSVDADGIVAIEGSVEAGAGVQSQEDVIISKGIIGHGTRVIARGDVSARFVHSGSIIAGGDVTTTQLVNANVRTCNLRVDDVEADDRSGSIVGGQVVATGRIEAARAGSPTTDKTQIAIVGDPEIKAQLGKLDKGLDFCRTNILRILRTLGIREIDAVQLKRLIEKAPPEKRQTLVKILTQLKQLVSTRDSSIKMRRGLEDEQEKLLSEAEIHISELVHADVHITIGERSFTPSDDIAGGAVFQLKGTRVDWRSSLAD